jgi:hypothetical protein
MTIVGNGDIASVLTDRPDFTFFASGVSNSACTDETEYEREIDLLLSQPHDTHLVYFSSLCVFYSDTRYAQHKGEMEEIVKATFDTWTIIRLGNINWGTNPHTLMNFLRDKKRKGEAVEIQDTHRYIVDRFEFLHWLNMIPPWSCEMCIPGEMMTVSQIWEELV